MTIRYDTTDFYASMTPDMSPSSSSSSSPSSSSMSSTSTSRPSPIMIHPTRRPLRPLRAILTRSLSSACETVLRYLLRPTGSGVVGWERSDEGKPKGTGSRGYALQTRRPSSGQRARRYVHKELAAHWRTRQSRGDGRQLGSAGAGRAQDHQRTPWQVCSSQKG